MQHKNNNKRVKCKLMMCSIVGPLNSHLWFNGDFKVDARHHSRKLLPASQSLEENAKLKKDWYSKHRSNSFTLPFLTNMVRSIKTGGGCVSLIQQILQTVLPQLFKISMFLIVAFFISSMSFSFSLYLIVSITAAFVAFYRKRPLQIVYYNFKQNQLV